MTSKTKRSARRCGADRAYAVPENGDIDGQPEFVLDYMIDHCVDGICILANYSEQFLPSDDERNTLLDLCIGHVRGRVPLVVACSHQVPIAPGGQLQMPLKC